VVTVMANIAAIRIEHARLMEEEQKRKMLARDLERAAEIQRRLLPASAPEIPGFDLAGYNAPCRTVGGDYFDFVPMPYGRLAILIGDVSGKGMGAALLVSHLQAATHLLFEEAEPLVSQISRLNRSVSANCPRNCFITLFAAILDLRTNELVYCNAGHNPPLVLRADDKVEQLAATGFPLGILRDALYDVNYCRLESGDVLVLYSDGVTEAASPDTDEDFGDKRLIAAVRRNRDRSSASIIEAVSAEVQAFTGGTPAADDVTLVLVRRY
jgi:phosphoserine phosphatase RsbU/P